MYKQDLIYKKLFIIVVFLQVDAMKKEELKKLDDKYILNSYKRYPLHITSGKGVYVFDEDGKKYLDFLSGIAVNSLGYSHPAIVQAIKNQAEKLIHTSNLFYTEPPVKLAKKLCEISGMNKVFFCNSGAEANELALKLAQVYSKNIDIKKNIIVAMNKSFHGRTIATLSITKSKEYGEKFAPLLENILFVDFNDIESLVNSVNKETAAIILEPVQGEGGINVASKEFVCIARELADKYGCLLISDEIQTGMGRTGQYFAINFMGIKPDIITLAKPLGAGLPIGALLMTDNVADKITYGDHGSTFGANCLASVAALAFIETIENEYLLNNINDTGKYFIDKLNDLKSKYSFIKEVRGLGFMIGMELKMPAGEIVLDLIKNGLICNCTADNVIRFLPPFITTKSDVDEALLIMNQVFAVVLKQEEERIKC